MFMRLQTFFTPSKKINLLPDSDKVLAEAITSELDKSYSDHLGPDPFKLRYIPTSTDENLKASSAISKYNLWGPLAPLPETINYTEGSNVIPYLAHFIWLGSVMTDPEIRNTILTWRDKNPNLPIIVWTDQISRKDRRSEEQSQSEMLNWCKKNNIALVNIEDLLLGQMELQAEFLSEMHRRNYGAASDILRLVILKKYGGTYSDIDISCMQKLEEMIRTKIGFRYNSAPREYVGSTNTDDVCNDMFQSIPGHPDIDAMIAQIKQNYQKPLRELNPKMALWSDPYEYKKEVTINRTGPAIIDRQRIQESIPPASFSYRFATTWLRPQQISDNYTSNERLLAIKQVISNILLDLKSEPRVLRLDVYAPLLHKYNITGVVLHTLLHAYPEIKTVENVAFARFADVKTAEYIWNEFPNIRNNKEFIANSFNYENVIPNHKLLEWLVNKKIVNINEGYSRPYLINLCNLSSNKLTNIEDFKRYFDLALKLEAKMDCTDFENSTPLKEICRTLNNSPYGIDALYYVLQHCNKEILNPPHGNLLHEFITDSADQEQIKNNCKAIEILTKAGVDPNKYNSSFDPPIFSVLSSLNGPMINTLLDNGVDPRISFNGQTPLDFNAGRIERIKKSLADPNQQEHHPSLKQRRIQREEYQQKMQVIVDQFNTKDRKGIYQAR